VSRHQNERLFLCTPNFQLAHVSNVVEICHTAMTSFQAQDSPWWSYLAHVRVHNPRYSTLSLLIVDSWLESDFSHLTVCDSGTLILCYYSKSIPKHEGYLTLGSSTNGPKRMSERHPRLCNEESELLISEITRRCQ